MASADQTFNVGISGVTSNDVLGSTNNITFTLEVGADDFLIQYGVTGLQYTPFAGSALEAGIAIWDTYTGSPGPADFSFFFNPTFGGGSPYNSGGLIDLPNPPFPLALTDSNNDGSNDFTVEFFETIDDIPAGPGTGADGIYGGGTLDFRTIPEPGSAGLIALIGIVAVVRRRR